MPKSIEYSQRLTMQESKTSLFAYPLIFIIYMYRYSLSSIIGNQCRFMPTCSHYAEDALKKYGAVKGSVMAVKRIFRCHPWHAGGYDPVE